MEKVIIEFLERNNINLDNEVVCVGISTGVDSTVLLNLLMNLKEKLNINIVLCHVNHKKRKESETEEAYIRKFALENGLCLEVYHFDSSFDDNENFQSSARLKRLSFFDSVMDKYHSKYLFLAHHLNDDIETSVMHIIRGSNLKGYSGIEEVTCNNKGKYILRPLLGVLKDEIYDYARSNDIIYFEDESNNGDYYTRNRIRHHIVPKFFEENPNFKELYKQYKETLFNAYLVVCEKRDAFIKDFVFVLENEIKINIEDFNTLNDYFKSEVLFELLKKYELSKKNIEELLSFINSDKPNISLNYKNLYFCKQYNEVIIKDKQEISIEKVNIVVDKIGTYDINDKYELEVKAFSIEDYKKNENMLTNLNVIWYNSSMLPINLRNRCDGDKIKVSNGTKKIKDILIDHKIPKEQRDTLLLLAKGNEVINIFGIRKSYDLLKSINNDILILLKEKE